MTKWEVQKKWREKVKEKRKKEWLLTWNHFTSEEVKQIKTMRESGYIFEYISEKLNRSTSWVAKYCKNHQIITRESLA